MSPSLLALTVEDNAEQTELLRRMLEREGYEVFSAPDAETAIAAFPDIQPSLAIVDLRLPGVTGSECIDILRSRFPSCRIIVSSVLDEDEYPRADASLPKPFTGAMLHDLLAELTQ
ncbi:response regulator [Leucobacter aridicollis]|uniref:response regulator n=1 Tax=Leucobacter aridicollis TaxID=283878 RepID=UPI000E64B4AE|nr:response regulator [Leucobacter aridicollis]